VSLATLPSFLAYGRRLRLQGYALFADNTRWVINSKVYFLTQTAWQYTKFLNFCQYFRQHLRFLPAAWSRRPTKELCEEN